MPSDMTPDEVATYLEKHRLEEILADAVNDAVAARAEDPILFIIDVLAAGRQRKEEEDQVEESDEEGDVEVEAPAEAPAVAPAAALPVCTSE